MSWPTSIFSALLTGLLGLFVSGFIAALAVDWYHISSREGGSGYFVIALSILGFGGGLIIGLVIARLVAAGAHPGFVRALATSIGVVAGLGVVIGGVARALADVPPEIDGETMLLQVEVRWPEGQREPPVVVGSDEASVRLHSIPRFSHSVRASESGPLWMEDARQVDGRWVIPGAVRVFTSRGKRMLTPDIGDTNRQGFEVPLPGFPNRRNLEWSGWLPTFRPGVKVPPNLLSFRFRAQKVSSPIRTETIGPFEVQTMAYYFSREEQDGRSVFVGSSTFGLSYHGQPLPIVGSTSAIGDATEQFERIDDIAQIGGPRPAFLIHVDVPASSGYCYLVTEDGERARIEYVAETSNGMKGQVLTADNVLFHAAEKWKPVRGRIDRVSYAHPGIYRIGHAVVDTRIDTVRQFSADSEYYDISSVPPLGLSPDERSFVTYGSSSRTEPPPVLLVTDVVADTTYTLPIDPARMRYAKFETLDPAWLDHHFEWQRGHDGVDRLAERKRFVPIPYRGELSVESAGYQSYQWEKASKALRGVLLDFLVREFKAEREPADSDAYEIPVKIGGLTINVAHSGDFGYLLVSTDRGSPVDTTLVARIGERFDAVLATGKYDTLFGE
ncbi:MAG: hypothetical protein ABI587_15750 [Gemmatimonadales bacterium]